MKDDYLVIDKKVLPEIFQKVINTKKLIENGDVKGITEATKVTGISRSVFYKYKDYVFEFSKMSTGRKVTFSMMVRHEKGLLSTILNEISKEGGNILTINQGIPINDVANLNITMDISSMEKNFKVFLNEINNIDGVYNLELISIEDKINDELSIVE